MSPNICVGIRRGFFFIHVWEKWGKWQQTRQGTWQQCAQISEAILPQEQCLYTLEPSCVGSKRKSLSREKKLGSQSQEVDWSHRFSGCHFIMLKRSHTITFPGHIVHILTDHKQGKILFIIYNFAHNILSPGESSEEMFTYVFGSAETLPRCSLSSMGFDLSLICAL